MNTLAPVTPAPESQSESCQLSALDSQLSANSQLSTLNSQLSDKLLRVADKALDRFLQENADLSFADIAKALDIAAKFARQAADACDRAAQSSPLQDPEFQAALERIYPQPSQ